MVRRLRGRAGKVDKVDRAGRVDRVDRVNRATRCGQYWKILLIHSLSLIIYRFRRFLHR